MEKSEIASIRFGQSRFTFYMNKNVKKFLKEKEVGTQRLIPSASSWYKQVLCDLNLSYTKKKEIEVIFLLSVEETKKMKKEYSLISQSPLRFQDSDGKQKEEKIKFVVKIN